VSRSFVREVLPLFVVSCKQYSTQRGYVNRIVHRRQRRKFSSELEGELGMRITLISGDPNARDEPRGQSNQRSRCCFRHCISGLPV